MQTQLLRGSANGAVASRGCRGPSLAPPRGRRVVRARADPPNLEGNVTREYREDTGEVSVPTSKNADGSLYVDANAPVRVSPHTTSFLLLAFCPLPRPLSPFSRPPPPIALMGRTAGDGGHPSGTVSTRRPDRTTRAQLLDFLRPRPPLERARARPPPSRTCGGVCADTAPALAPPPQTNHTPPLPTNHRRARRARTSARR